MYEFQETIQSYSVQYVFEIITKGVEEIRKLERKKYLMPVLSEFSFLCIIKIGNRMKLGGKKIGPVSFSRT